MHSAISKASRNTGRSMSTTLDVVTVDFALVAIFRHPSAAGRRSADAPPLAVILVSQNRLRIGIRPKGSDKIYPLMNAREANSCLHAPEQCH